MTIGRPRTFDAEEALDRALDVFWEHGYEGASMTDLLTAMAMNKPSLYRVFGSKEALFRQAVQRYAERDMAYARAALAEPTAFRVAQTFLRDNVKAITQPDRPAGCLSLQGGLSCSAENADISQFLAASRLAGEEAMADRFRAALAEGDLPEGCDPVALARFVMIVSEGNAVHAAAGVSRAELEQSTEFALRAFPTASA